MPEGPVRKETRIHLIGDDKRQDLMRLAWPFPVKLQAELQGFQ
jgi:hypothetical protein